VPLRVTGYLRQPTVWAIIPDCVPNIVASPITQVGVGVGDGAGVVGTGVGAGVGVGVGGGVVATAV